MVYGSVRLDNCGCWYIVSNDRQYLPQVDLKARTTILATASRTTLTQTFVNPDIKDIDNVKYTFPLFDGVSVVAFKAQIGDRTIHGTVKEHRQAKAEYQQAVKKGKKAALLEQSLSASDTFTTTIGNVPALSEAVVHITYLGVLVHDAQADGVRLTVPSVIAPRYGSNVAPLDSGELPGKLSHIVKHGNIDITVDVEMGKGSRIKTIQSPSHPVTVSLGRMSVSAEDVFEGYLASAAYDGRAGDVFFEKDFVVIVQAIGQDIPCALLEAHPTIPNQRAIMTSLVPKFNLPNASPEIVFIIDRSGSMYDKIDTLKSALRVFLKSLPVGIKFNICSFGSTYSFMWGKSQTYDASTLAAAMEYVESIDSSMGGTEMTSPIQSTVDNRFQDMELEVLILTDGQISNQDQLFKYIDGAVEKPIRFFTLGIGDQASHSLVQGIARAGNGFAQSVGTNEKLDRKVVRMLKGALTPHVNDYTLEVEYDEADDDEYDIVEKSNNIPAITLPVRQTKSNAGGDKLDVDEPEKKEAISLFDPNFKEAEMPKSVDVDAELPSMSPPKIIQAPYKIPSLYAFSRTSFYLLLSADTNPRVPKSVTLRGTSKHGPLQLTIPIENVGKGATIHQLAARKVMLELEEGRGWVYNAKDTDGKVVVEEYESKKEDLVKREAVRLGLKFQVGGKWCSFVAVEGGKGTEHAAVEAESTIIANMALIDDTDTESDEEESEKLDDQYLAHNSVGSGSKKKRATRQSQHITAQPMQQAQFAPGPQTATYTPPSPVDFSTMSLFSGGMSSVAPPRSSAGYASGRASFCSFGGARDCSTGGRKLGEAKRSLPRTRQSARKSSSGGTRGGTRGGGYEPESFSASSFAVPAQPTEVKEEDKVHAVISLQLFEGSWEWTDRIFKIMNIQPKSVESLDWSTILGMSTASGLDKGDSNIRNIIATFLVALYLDTKWAEEKETWELVYDKAMGWVDSATTNLGGDISKRDLQPLSAVLA